MWNLFQVTDKLWLLFFLGKSFHRCFWICCRSPFDLSLATLVVMCVIIAMKWVENYGDASATALHSFGAALTAIKTGQW